MRPGLGEPNLGALVGAVVGAIGGLFAVGIAPAIIDRNLAVRPLDGFIVKWVNGWIGATTVGSFKI